MKQATIKDVAEAARCSTTLVSRVMNAPRREDGSPDCVVNPKTAERIFEAVRTLGYKPNKAAVSLRKKLKKRIGVILPDLSNQFFAGIAKHFETLAQQNGYVVLFGSSNDNAEKLSETAETFIEDGVDGIVITPGVNCSNAIKRIIDGGTHVILIVRDLPEIKNVGKILLDSKSATETVLDHLIEQGYRRIDMLSLSHRIPNVEEREMLYTEYMQQLGLPHKIHHASESNVDLEIIMEQALRSGTDALYCISASLPIRCVLAGKSRGIKFPKDLALTGYDGGYLYNAISPSMTQIEYSKEEIAKETFNMLMEIIASQDKVPEYKYLKGKFTVGESTTKTSTEKSASPKTDAKDVIRKAISSLEETLRSLD